MVITEISLYTLSFNKVIDILICIACKYLYVYVQNFKIHYVCVYSNISTYFISTCLYMWKTMCTLKFIHF